LLLLLLLLRTIRSPSLHRLVLSLFGCSLLLPVTAQLCVLLLMLHCFGVLLLLLVLRFSRLWQNSMWRDYRH
jgi:hypothetical protein